MRVGYFCSAGYTEAGGMQQFLERIRPDIEWRRCFPAHDKPAPKFGRSLPQPKSAHGGTTGRALVDRMLEILADESRRPRDIDAVLLIDDVDCRPEVSLDSFALWVQELQEKVRRAAERADLRFIAFLASPEIEAWLLVDWEKSFGLEEKYSTFAHELRRKLEERLGPVPWSSIEEYGRPYLPDKGSCSRKLSEDIQAALDVLAAEHRERLGEQDGSFRPSVYVYSKRSNGPYMLRRSRPEKIADVCALYFRPVYQELCRLGSGGDPGSPASDIAPAREAGGGDEPAKAQGTRRKVRARPKR